ncbi:hypothetical protein LTR87_017589, partial [Friedmanniomyces endolithicus]
KLLDKARTLKALREDYFVRTDDAVNEAPFTEDGEVSMDDSASEPKVNLIPERAKLAEFVGIEDPRTSSTRADAVQTMVALRSRVEPNRSLAQTHSPSSANVEEPPADTANKVASECSATVHNASSVWDDALGQRPDQDFQSPQRSLG